jgi:hypothetical protein
MQVGVVAVLVMELLEAQAVTVEAVLVQLDKVMALLERLILVVVAVVLVTLHQTRFLGQRVVQEFLLLDTQRHRWTNGTLG